MFSRRQLFIGAAALAAGCAHTEAQATFVELEQVLGGRIGFSALDTGSGRRITWRGGERFALCSTFKAALAAAVLKRIDAGELRRDDVLTIDAADLLPTSRVTALRGSTATSSS
jgi:beta-lactamase class A